MDFADKVMVVDYDLYDPPPDPNGAGGVGAATITEARPPLRRRKLDRADGTPPRPSPAPPARPAEGHNQEDGKALNNWTCPVSCFDHNALHVFGNKTARSLASDLEERELAVLGIIEANIMFRTDYDYYDYTKLLIFARREGYVYAQVLESGLFEREGTRPARPLVRGQFVKLSQTEDEPRKVYETFDEMMIDAIQDALLN